MSMQWLRVGALAIGFYLLLTGVHYGTLWGLDGLRQRWEARLESQYGVEAIDREPPYKPGERAIMALDIQRSPFWQESLGISALLSLLVALLTGVAARFAKRARRAALLLVPIASNIVLLWLMTQLGGLALAGYLVGNLTAVFVGGALVGLIQGIVALLLLAPRRR
ncbi:MAG: hypothetical protein ABDI19_02260 [Armatimonadota bacterium]